MSNAAGDFYAVLGVSRGATADEIQAAYRKLARKHHPDVAKEASSAETFKKVNEAYEVLKDPKKRELYDRFGANWKAADQAGVGAPGRGGGGGRGQAGHSPGPDDFSGFGDIFESVFGAGMGSGRSGSRRRPRSRPGRDVESEIEVPLADVVHGGSRHVAFEDDEGERRELTVKIPPGATDGSVIRLSGQGEPGIGGGPPGDLLLRIRIAPDARFSVDGHDLTTVVAVAPWEAVLGAKIPAPTPGGDVVVTVPPGTSSGQRLRLRGKGLPTRGGGAGDLFVEIKIVVPKHPTDRERELFERLRDESNFDPRRT